MTQTNDNAPSHGKFVSLGEFREPIRIDCTEWTQDIPPEQWSRGKFVSLSEFREPIRVDCSASETPAPVTLVLTLDLAQGADAIAVRDKVVRLIETLSNFEKTLGGAGVTWDPKQSTAADGTVTMVLVPNDPTGAELRLEAMAKVTAATVAEFGPVVRIQAGVNRVAA
jgi:hypothetical protein